jgi:transaldolase
MVLNMIHKSYFHWLTEETPTSWWHDSADMAELQDGLDHNATGATTNPVLSAQALKQNPAYWQNSIDAISKDLDNEARAQEAMRIVVTEVASKFMPIFEKNGGKQGYACAQVNPSLAGNRDAMLEQARRFHCWAPNISVKLPVTAAGLDVLEECAAEGICTTLTVSFTVPQVLAAAESFERGLARALKAGVADTQCFPVIMIGRLDDYLREVAADCKAEVSEDDIRKSGLAAVKRAYELFKEREYKSVLIIAALRGNYHMTELAGAELIMSIHPKHQANLLAPDVPREQRIDIPIDAGVIERLSTIPEFVRAYEPDGIKPEEFITYGTVQRTLSQFIESGWKQLQGV